MYSEAYSEPDDAADIEAQRRADQGVWTLGVAERIAHGTMGRDLLVPQFTDTPRPVPKRLPLSSRASDRDAELAGVNTGCDSGPESVVAKGTLPDSVRKEWEEIKRRRAEEKIAKASLAGSSGEVSDLAARYARQDGDGTGNRPEKSRIRTRRTTYTHPALKGHVTDATTG